MAEVALLQGFSTHRAFTDVGWPISSTADFLELQKERENGREIIKI